MKSVSVFLRGIFPRRKRIRPALQLGKHLLNFLSPLMNILLRGLLVPGSSLLALRLGLLIGSGS